MGMAAQKLKQHSSMVYQHLAIERLRELARQEHPEHTDEAARVFVDRILDMEVERRTMLDGHLLGYGSISSTALIGESRGGNSNRKEPLAALYDRGIKVHKAHDDARSFIAQARLPDRQLLAVLIRARKLDRRLKGEWGRSYDQIAASISYYAQQLGWPPLMANEWFNNGRAIIDSAKVAQATLILLAKT